MKTNDYVKYLTVEWLVYMNQPKELRKEQRRSHKVEKEPFLTNWFGIVPLSIGMLFRRKRRGRDGLQ